MGPPIVSMYLVYSVLQLKPQRHIPDRHDFMLTSINVVVLSLHKQHLTLFAPEMPQSLF
jgi:hypothetical protein